MIANFVHTSSFPLSQPTSSSRLLLEPLLVVGTSIFWMITLPIAALFCVTLALYDRIAGLGARQFRIPFLRWQLCANPLVLRQKARRTGEQSASADGVHHPIGA
jgi:hypothetical protein